MKDSKTLFAARNCMGLAANAIFLVYLVVYAVAQPCPALVAAVVFELVFFVGLTVYRVWKAKTPSAQKVADAVETIEQSSKLVYWWRRLSAGATATVCGIAIIYMAIDMSALLLADCGRPDLAAPIYERIAILPRNGIHPALSMELLTGAYIDAHKYEKAEPLEMTLLQIRRDLAGEQSELVATMYFNIGEYYAKRDMVAESISYYNRAIVLTKELRLPQGWGSPMTQLGVLFRDNHRYAEAEDAFRSAIAVRTRLFGPDSLKVRDTLKEYAFLKRLEHDDVTAQRMEGRIAAIDSQHPMLTKRSADVSPLVVMAVSLMIFLFRDRLVLLFADVLKRREQLDQKP